MKETYQSKRYSPKVIMDNVEKLLGNKMNLTSSWYYLSLLYLN